MHKKDVVGTVTFDPDILNFNLEWIFPLLLCLTLQYYTSALHCFKVGNNVKKKLLHKFMNGLKAGIILSMLRRCCIYNHSMYLSA